MWCVCFLSFFLNSCDSITFDWYFYLKYAHGKSKHHVDNDSTEIWIWKLLPPIIISNFTLISKATWKLMWMSLCVVPIMCRKTLGHTRFSFQINILYWNSTRKKIVWFFMSSRTFGVFEFVHTADCTEWALCTKCTWVRQLIHRNAAFSTHTQNTHAIQWEGDCYSMCMYGSAEHIFN